MDIQVSGHHLSANDIISSVVRDSLKKLENRYPSLVKVGVTLKSDNKVRSVEARTIYKGSSISVSSDGKTIREAIRTTIRKLDAVLSKRKGALRSGRNEKLRIEDTSSLDLSGDEYDVD